MSYASPGRGSADLSRGVTMIRKREVDLEHQQALIPLFGAVDKKPRPLDREVITIGRARGCDIGLDAPEISTLHCLLYRTADGYRVRDCGSRTGTRVNGDVPRAAVLAEGDVLQIGPFGFSVRIPPSARPDPGRLDAGRWDHCQRSRRNLVQLALDMRSRLHKHRREDTMNDQEQRAAEQADAGVLLEKQRASLNQADVALREQRSELARMMSDLRELQAAIKKQQGADVHALIQENEELRQVLGEYESRVAEGTAKQAAGTSGELEEIKGENELLRKLLQEKESAELILRQQLEEMKNEAPAKPPARAENMDLESYETELNQFRQQLESDRAKLNKEFEQLRLRNAELDEATREMEMAMSKERAELGRERIRLDRLREDVRSDVERVQREAGMRESLAPVNKLREEISQKKGTGKEEGTRLGDRLRSFRNRLTDSPS
jgi:hypothetical protein